jgi:membrane protein
VPIVLVPLSLATLVVVFGRQIEGWMIDNAGHELRHIVLFFWRMVRWSIALAHQRCRLTASTTSAPGARNTGSGWRPGAVTGTLLWFPATLAFGWYVTRIADYSMFYGSFGAGIATLVWLYITAFSVLIGAELNGVLFGNARKRLRLLEIPPMDFSSL